MNEDYWKKFWNEADIVDKDEPHNQVGRTKFGKKIGEDTWDKTVRFLIEKLELKPSHTLLDLCAGNGVLSANLIDYANSIVAVDVSKKLLESFVIEHQQIMKVHSDILQYDFPQNYFDRIIFYFSAQHFSEMNMAKIVSMAYKSLKEKGILYIGDIPNVSQKWDFYDTSEYRSFLFKRWLKGGQHIGYWYDRCFFEYIADYIGFSQCDIVTQPSFMINSSYRFDVLLRK